MKDGQEAKGVIVEDYQDRVVLSTDTGEKPYFKKDIEKLEYDSSEDNMLKLADIYKDKEDYKTALYYYQSVCELNPKLKEAQNGALLMTNMIMQKRERDLQQQVAMKQDTEQEMGKSSVAGMVPPDISLKDKELQRMIGISIQIVNSQVVITKVLRNSPAFETGLKANDVIVSLWGKFIKYMQLPDIYTLFLTGTVNEVKIVVAREAALSIKEKGLFSGAENMIGGKFSMEFEGLTVAEVKKDSPLEEAGIVPGDRVTKIQLCSTRYMSLDEAYKLIEKAKIKTVSIVIEKECSVWKRG